MNRPARPTVLQVNLHLDPNYRATKTMTQIYEQLLAEGCSPESLGGLRQLAEAERDPDLPPSLQGLHASYKAIMARQAAEAAEERAKEIPT